MSELLILDGPCNPKRHPNLAYRGTFRMSPAHFDSLPEDHEANMLFSWFIEEGGTPYKKPISSRVDTNVTPKPITRPIPSKVSPSRTPLLRQT
jgi:hypothetical protein